MLPTAKHSCVRALTYRHLQMGVVEHLEVSDTGKAEITNTIAHS